jgi:hypothetical protein
VSQEDLSDKSPRLGDGAIHEWSGEWSGQSPGLARIRKAALIACIAGALSALIPLWNGVLMMGAAALNRPLDFWLVAMALLATCTMPVLTFSLFRNEGTLHFPKQIRQLALGAALSLGLLLILSLPQWIGLLGPYFSALRTVQWSAGTIAIWSVLRDPRTIYHVTTLLAEVSSLAMIVLLISFYRYRNDEAGSGVAVSGFLRIATRTTVVIWGIWLGFNIIRGLLAPYTYLQLRNYAAQMHRPAPEAISVVGELLKTMLSVACLFCVPYIVSRSLEGSPRPEDSVVSDRGAAPETN